MYGVPEFDERDQSLLDERMAKLDKIGGPRVGDWVIFADGTERRISYVWPASDLPDVQTSNDGGGWSLNSEYPSYSGGLFSAVFRSTLTDTGETRPGQVWLFHHDLWTAHNGVYTSVAFRVFRCSEAAPR